MLRRSLVLALAVSCAALAGGALATSGTDPAPLRPQAQSAEGGAIPLTCEVRQSRANGLLKLDALVRGARSVSGDYRFAVTSRSGSGASRSTQNGTFDLKPKEEAVLGTIGLDAAAAFEAKLTLTLPEGDVVCEAEG